MNRPTFYKTKNWKCCCHYCSDCNVALLVSVPASFYCGGNGKWKRRLFIGYDGDGETSLRWIWQGHQSRMDTSKATTDYVLDWTARKLAAAAVHHKHVC